LKYKSKKKQKKQKKTEKIIITITNNKLTHKTMIPW